MLQTSPNPTAIARAKIPRAVARCTAWETLFHESLGNKCVLRSGVATRRSWHVRAQTSPRRDSATVTVERRRHERSPRGNIIFSFVQLMSLFVPVYLCLSICLSISIYKYIHISLIFSLVSSSLSSLLLLLPSNVLYSRPRTLDFELILIAH